MFRYLTAAILVLSFSSSLAFRVPTRSLTHQLLADLLPVTSTARAVLLADLESQSKTETVSDSSANPSDNSSTAIAADEASSTTMAPADSDSEEDVHDEGQEDHEVEGNYVLHGPISRRSVCDCRRSLPASGPSDISAIASPLVEEFTARGLVVTAAKHALKVVKKVGKMFFYPLKMALKLAHKAWKLFGGGKFSLPKGVAQQLAALPAVGHVTQFLRSNPGVMESLSQMFDDEAIDQL